MISTKSRITQGKLDQALADIRQYISEPKDWQLALKELSSIKDYSMGEERFCTSTAALEHCEQIKGYFPPSTPDSARKNIDAIADEIRQIQQGEVPDSVKLALPLILIGLAIAVYWLFFR